MFRIVTRAFDEKLSAVSFRCLHYWGFTYCCSDRAGEAMQHRTTIKCAVLLVLSPHRRPKVLVRRQADAVEIIAALAARSNGTSGRSRARTDPPRISVQFLGCSGISAGRFRQFRSALASALFPRSWKIANYWRSRRRSISSRSGRTRSGLVQVRAGCRWMKG